MSLKRTVKFWLSIRRLHPVMNSVALFCFFVIQIHLLKCQNHLTCAAAEAEKGENVVSKAKPVSRIVGEAVNATYAPYHVGLHKGPIKGEKGEIRYSCGGTIISQRHILTASHCLTAKGRDPIDLETQKIYVLFGQFDRCMGMEEVTNNPEGPWKNVVLAKKIFLHSNYDEPQRTDNDIGIIEVYIDYKTFPFNMKHNFQLSKDLTFEKGKIQPACLPPNSAYVPIWTGLTYTFIFQKLFVCFPFFHFF